MAEFDLNKLLKTQENLQQEKAELQKKLAISEESEQYLRNTLADILERVSKAIYRDDPKIIRTHEK